MRCHASTADLKIWIPECTNKRLLNEEFFDPPAYNIHIFEILCAARC